MCYETEAVDPAPETFSRPPPRRSLPKETTMSIFCLESGFRISLAAIFLSICIVPAFGAPVVLYEGSLIHSAEAQGWLYFSNPPGPFAQAGYSEAGGTMILDTMPLQSESAGFFSHVPPLNHSHPNNPTLDRNRGFTVWLDLRIIRESHEGSDHRAGFSLIAIDKDRLGLEIGFWENRVWVQDDEPVLFVRGEGAAVDTTAGISRYGLWVRGMAYQIWKDGNEILDGSLRDYTAFTDNGGVFSLFNPYRTPNFLFFGDDTSSARTEAEVAKLSVSLHVPGDLNADGQASVSDAIVALQVLAGMSPSALDPEWAVAGGDVDGDFTAGLAEAVYALQWSAAVRP